MYVALPVRLGAWLCYGSELSIIAFVYNTCMNTWSLIKNTVYILTIYHRMMMVNTRQSSSSHRTGTFIALIHEVVAHPT